MRHSKTILALAAALAAAAPLALAAPHGGGMGGMGGGPNFIGVQPVGGGSFTGRSSVFPGRSVMSGPRSASPDTAGSGPQRQATSSSTTNNGIARKGQPSQSCQAAANYPADTPGNSFNSPGSAFDPNGNADTRYAGAQPQNSKNPKSVAQYDVACTNQKPK